MNERITKIVIDTLGKEGVVNSRAFGHWALSDEELEKFAELIVRECAELTTKEYNNRGAIHGDDVLKHFGVKE
jgi:hypothetical protein